MSQSLRRLMHCPKLHFLGRANHCGCKEVAACRWMGASGCERGRPAVTERPLPRTVTGALAPAMGK
jgi:hypothetical protein